MEVQSGNFKRRGKKEEYLKISNCFISLIGVSFHVTHFVDKMDI